MEGEITEALRNRMFRLKLDNGHEMIGYTAGTDEAVPDPDAPRRPRPGRAVAVRPRPRPHRLPPALARRHHDGRPSRRAPGSSSPASSPVTSRRSPTVSGPISLAAREALRLASGQPPDPARAEGQRLPRPVRPRRAGGADRSARSPAARSTSFDASSASSSQPARQPVARSEPARWRSALLDNPQHRPRLARARR